jgi:hypothetical protein
MSTPTRRRTKRRPANAWPWWKLKALLPDGRRFAQLRLVELPEFMRVSDHGEAMTVRSWQFQHRDGRSAGVGLFTNRDVAMAWAKTHCRQVDLVAATEEVA